jgi:hypothetical protein
MADENIPFLTGLVMINLAEGGHGGVHEMYLDVVYLCF